MIYVGIDVSKDKHDCCIVNSDGKVLADVFTVENNMEGFDLLFQGLKSVARDLDNVKVGLEPPAITATTSSVFSSTKV